MCDIWWVMICYLDLWWYCLPCLTLGSQWVFYGDKYIGVARRPHWERKTIVVTRVTANFHISSRGMEVDKGENTHFTFLRLFCVIYTNRGGAQLLFLSLKMRFLKFLKFLKFYCDSLLWVLMTKIMSLPDSLKRHRVRHCRVSNDVVPNQIDTKRAMET